MRMRVSAVSVAAVFLFTANVHAQLQQPQVVQLPTFSFFTVSTTVSVPDSGRGFVGGVQRHRSAGVSRSLPWVARLPAAGRLAGSRALASETSASGAGVTATVMDLDELDAAVLAAAGDGGRSRSGAVTEEDRKALFLSRHTGKTDSAATDLTLGSPATSLVEIRRENTLLDAQRDAELREYWDTACKAESAGRKGAARCAYAIVARRATGELQAAALRRLEDLNDN